MVGKVPQNVLEPDRPPRLAARWLRLFNFFRSIRPSWPGGAGPARATALLLLVLAPNLLAHDIPANATVRVFVRPEGDRLRLLLRMQMASIQEIEWPVLKENGNLDLTAVGPYLKEGADKWIGAKLEVYEGATKVGP